MGYELYKLTDQLWYPEIPFHWNYWRAKRIFDNPKLRNDGNVEGNVLSLTLRGVIRNNKDNPIGLAPADYSTYQIFEADDLVFKLIDLENISTSRVGIVPERGIMSSAYIRFAAREDINIRFFYYQYRDWWLRHVFNGLGAGVRQTLSANDLLNLKIVIPPREEQDQIVRYLDWQVSKINKLIHGYQRQIKLLQEKWLSEASYIALHGIHIDVEMKVANVMGFERIPSHWRILQNKRIFRERSDHSESGSEALLSVSKHYGVKPYDALEDGEKFATIKPAESLIGYKKVSPGNLAMNIMRARNGSYGMSEYEGIVSPAYCVYETIIPVNQRYIHYLLKTPQVVSLFEAYSYGICEHRRRLYAPDFLRISIPLPPLNEQTEIAEYLEGEKEKVDFAIKRITDQIELLKEYRTRLISDVVTGQKDVRGIVIPDYEPEIEEDNFEEVEDTEAMESEVSSDE